MYRLSIARRHYWAFPRPRFMGDPIRRKGGTCLSHCKRQRMGSAVRHRKPSKPPPCQDRRMRKRFGIKDSGDMCFG